jgi:hypothetical protein
MSARARPCNLAEPTYVPGLTQLSYESQVGGSWCQLLIASGRCIRARSRNWLDAVSGAMLTFKEGVCRSWKLGSCRCVHSQQRPILATGGVVPRYLALFPRSALNIPESTRFRSQRLVMVEMFPRVSTKWSITRYPPRLVRFGAPRRGRAARVSPK